MSTPNVLPDSRLTHNPTLGSVMMDWPVGDGTTVRLECVPIFCANCGKSYGFVPKDNTTFAFWLCDPCFDKHGPPPGTYVSSDHAFREKVKAEMLEKFGRILTAEELQAMADAGRLGSLEKLLRESGVKEFRRG